MSMVVNKGRIKSDASIKKSLTLIAGSLKMRLEDYAVRTRLREYVYLRMIGELYLRQNHPDVRLSEMAEFFGYEDHSTVVNLHASALYKLKNREDFRESYNKAMDAVKINS